MNIKESTFRMTFVDVPRWHKILTFLAADRSYRQCLQVKHHEKKNTMGRKAFPKV